MDDILCHNLEYVESLAQQDEIFQVWKHSREQFAAEFAAYVNGQPEEIRNMLLGFAGSSELMVQRKLILACQHLQQHQQ